MGKILCWKTFSSNKLMVYFAKTKFREKKNLAKIMAATINCAKKTFQILCSESFGLLVLLYDNSSFLFRIFVRKIFSFFLPKFSRLFFSRKFRIFRDTDKAKFREKRENLRNFRERTKCKIFAKIDLPSSLETLVLTKKKTQYASQGF